MAGRCKACDKILADSEIIWNEDAQLHEELCGVCRSFVRRDLNTGSGKEQELVSGVVHMEDLLDDMATDIKGLDFFDDD